MAKPDPKTYDTLTNQDTNPFTDTNKLSLTIEEEETPQSTGLVIHVVPESNKTRWNHIEDLDSFFTRVYHYHQKHGFYVMMLQKVLELVQFMFVSLLITYVPNCIDFSILSSGIEEIHKITLADMMSTPAECASKLSTISWILLILATFFWIFRLCRFIYHCSQFYDIKLFFNTALKIDDSDLDNLTWHEVQKRIREVQSEIQMSINKEQLTELDIYHRILRFKNYMVAMMNKSLLPSTIRFPFLGSVVCLSQALRYNIGLILFWGPWSPFESNWHLREEFKRSNRRNELAHRLGKQIMWIAIVNICLSPLIFLCQLMYFFFNYVDLIKKEPGILALRCWSQYGKLYLRHFNELDHELDARLTRAYRPAVKYMDSFSSPLLTVIGRNVSFICGGLASLIFILTLYDEAILQVQNVFTMLALLSTASIISRSVIPDENMIWCPDQLMQNVLAHVHYLPASWRGYGRTSRVRKQFEQIFQLKAMYILNELFSPFVAPFVLLFVLRPKAIDLVDFFRNFTVDVVGVGDVCSFAQMDVRRHGNPDWQVPRSAIDDESSDTINSPQIETNQYNQGEHGKTELSLVHFTLTNPTWQMPPEARHFVQGIKHHALRDFNKQQGVLMAGTTTVNMMTQSLLSVESLGDQYRSIIQPILQNRNLYNSQHMGMSSNMGGPATMPSGQFQQSTAHSHYQYNSPPAFDFERMIQQNLDTAGSTAPFRSTTLHNINENDNEEEATAGTSQMPQSCFTPGVGTGRLDPRNTMSFSTKGGMRRKEGPAEGSNNGLLKSLYADMQPPNAALQFEITTADMCLSTLYLHELHHSHMRRRGASLCTDPSQRQSWQRPHQVESPPRVQPSTSGATTSGFAAERTPLLSSKKS